MRVRLAYGRKGLWIELPDGAPVTVIEPGPAPGLPDERAALLEALRAPIGTPPLQDLAGPAELARMLGDDVLRRYRIVQHNAWDEAGLVEVTRNRIGNVFPSTG